MRIIGGHDYYDKAAAHGIDTTVIFKRENTEVEIPFKVERPSAGYYFALRRGFSIRYGWVYVADRVYGYIRVSNSSWEGQSQSSIFWKADEFLEFMQKYEVIQNHPHRKRAYIDKVLNKLVEHFGEKETPKKVQEFLIEKKFAILHTVSDDDYYKRVTKGIGNPDDLRTIGFASVIDPYTMFQKIDMWVSGVLTNTGNPTVEITDDKIKLAKHGFDDKTSFRNPIK